jgi:hypothetical protein
MHLQTNRWRPDRDEAEKRWDAHVTRKWTPVACVVLSIFPPQAVAGYLNELNTDFTHSDIGSALSNNPYPIYASFTDHLAGYIW